MTAPPINAAQPTNRANAQPSERRHSHEDAIARFHQALEIIQPASVKSDFKTAADTEPGSGNIDFKSARDFEHRDPAPSTLPIAVSGGYQHSSFLFSEPAAAEPAIPTQTGDTTRLIEQATSVMLGRATRADECRFIVSLDHAIVGGASAEFIRDGAFLQVRLHARNDAAYRSMWTHRADLEERLAASTGLTTRVEIVEVHGNGGPV